MPVPQLAFTRGRLYTYQIVAGNKQLAQIGPLALDLGFREQHSIPLGAPRVKVLVVYLRDYQLLPSSRTTELFKDTFNTTISEGTLDTILRESAENLTGFMNDLKEHMINARVAHFDETGLSENGENHWLHSVSTQDATYYAMHRKRGREAIDDIGILPKFQGTAVHDGWGAYFQYEQCWQGLCNAHHLRELIFVKEQLGQSWAQSMIDCLLKIKEAVEQAKEQGRMSLSDEQIYYWRHRYKSIIAQGYQANPWHDPSGEEPRGQN